MFQAFRSIRSGERRDAWTAFALLFGLIASHSVLETARDALFLSSVPAARLPWMYLAITAVSLALTRVQTRLGRVLGGRAALGAWIGAAALITALFWLFLDSLGPAGLYALYIWSGVLTTLVLVHFWTLLGDIFTITQAKRLYSVIGAGSVLGAITGSAAASALSQIVPPAELLLVSAAGLGFTALCPLLMRPGKGVGASPVTQPIGIGPGVRYVKRKPYAAWLVTFVVISAAGLTFADYLFKSQVAAAVPAADLGRYFATIYLALNLLSLFTQLALIGWLLRRFDIMTALSLLPAFLLVGSFAMLAVPGLIAALIIKGADGGLRYSVHRTATELLYVPLSEHGRRLVKGFLDVVGQRGGQAVASIGILAITALTTRPQVLAILLALCAAGWLVTAMRLRGHYLELFRHRVRRGQVEHLDEFPDLDLASLENIVAALDSSDVREILAALEILEREGRDSLIPALTLYHPEEDVVLHALPIMARARRKRASHAIEHLLDHPSPAVRASAAAAFSILTEDEQRLRLRLSGEESSAVRATIMVNLIAAGAVVGSDARDNLDALLAHGTSEVKIALARAIAWRRAPGFDDVLLGLASTTEPSVRVAAAEAMARLESPAFMPILVDFLGHEATRHAAINALAACGERGLDALRQALADRSLPPVVRWQVPVALRAFDLEQAWPLILVALPEEHDGMVRYRMIRTLEHLQQSAPDLRLGRTTRSALDRAIASTVSRAYRYLDRRLILKREAAKDPSRVTPGHELLVTSLADKQMHAVERLFRLLGLAHPTQPFDHIYRGLTSEQTRASSLELLENILRPPLRSAVVGLADDLPDEDRLGACSAFHEPLRLDYQGVLASMLDSESETIKSITVFHIGELGLVEFRDRIEKLADTAVSQSDLARTRALLEAAAEGSNGRPVAIAGAPPGDPQAVTSPGRDAARRPTTGETDEPDKPSASDRLAEPPDDGVSRRS